MFCTNDVLKPKFLYFLQHHFIKIKRKLDFHMFSPKFLKATFFNVTYRKLVLFVCAAVDLLFSLNYAFNVIRTCKNWVHFCF